MTHMVMPLPIWQVQLILKTGMRARVLIVERILIHQVTLELSLLITLISST